MSHRKQSRFARRGVAVAVVAVSGTVLIGFAALAIDMSMLYNVRTEAQRASDAGALAGAWKLLSEDALKPGGAQAVIAVTRQTASSLAHQNPVFNSNPTVDQNIPNSTDGDVVLGHFNNPADPNEQLNTQATKYNAVKVVVRRDEIRNGPIPLTFSRVFGVSTKDVSASATAAFDDNVIGFKTPGNGTNPQILPIAVDVNTWDAFVKGNLEYGDMFTYDATNDTVSSLGDGIPELNIWPGGGGNQGGAGNGGGSLQLTPGNWGTVKIGVTNNATPTLEAQIRYGITAAQMATFPDGEMKLDAEGKLYLGGNPGMSNGIKAALTDIIGQTRIIPLYSYVGGTGNNTTYTIVGFGGTRIVGVHLTGSPGSRYVLVQPAIVVDAGAIGGTQGTSYNVYRPPALVR